jgi:hypothetical protein
MGSGRALVFASTGVRLPEIAPMGSGKAVLGKAVLGVQWENR